MKIKSMFIFLVLNIFTVMAVSILYEYISIQDKLEQLENTVSLALERSVYNSTASEELFTNNFAEIANLSAYSYGTKSASVGLASDTANSISVWTGDKFVSTNAYGLTIQNVGFPLTKATGNITGWNNATGTTTTRYTSTLLNTINGYNSTDVFEYLYGDVTNHYTSVSWASLGSQETKNYADSANSDVTKPVSGCLFAESNGSTLPSKPTYTASGVREDFADYYSEIGSKIVTANFVKKQDTSNNRYTLTYMTYPTLADMGLSVTASDGKNYANLNNDIMTDNWCQVVKIGKKRTDTSSGAIIKRSYYYLTPYSLGVTYIPKDVLKETFIANLDTMCRLTKLGSSAIIYNNQTNGMENATTKEILNSATGCIADGDGNETSVYHNGVSNKHQTTSTENIINDGIIEYDLSTIQLKVEYFVVDFWDTNNAIVVNRCVGQVAKSYETNDDIKTKLQNNVKDYRDNDTGYNYLKSLSNTTTKYYLNGSEINLAQGYEANQGNTVVAKVSARVKVHIPYDNAFIQWAVEKYTYHRGGSEHYDIKLYNAANSAQDFRDGTYTDEDGVWYQTSIYYAVTN